MTSDVEATKRIRQSEEQNTEQRANLLGLKYFNTQETSGSLPLISGFLSIEEMYQGVLVPLREPADEQDLVFAITINTPQPLLRTLRERFDNTGVSFVLISNTGFRELMLRYDPPKKVVYDNVEIASEGDSTTLQKVSTTLETVRSDDILNFLITQAYQLGASDIHIEPERPHVRIRFRVDGTLHPIAEISHEKYRVLFASIASRANVSTVEDDAQTGHLQQQITTPEGKQDILNMRIETVPTTHGQEAVIRLFNYEQDLLNLERLGLSDDERREVEEVVKHPHGMLMVVGPTGSGKSTTLYSIINALNNSSRKILTLEDPVEFDVVGITQIPVATRVGDSFANKLKAVLRLDPDVVMLGEVRDADTARTAIQASITGHLVLTTFHAASASAALARVIDMIGINPVFATAIRMIIGQRLVRKLDDESKIAYTPDESTKNWIRETLRDLPERIEKPNLDDFQLWKPGKSEASPFGYKGRIVIMEQMVINEKIQAFLRGDATQINTNEIESAARQDGMVTMLQQGVLRALKGDTTIEEINRVI